MKTLALALALSAACSFDGVDPSSGADASPTADAPLQADSAPSPDSFQPAINPCEQSGLILCYRFDGQLVDESPSPKSPDTETGLSFANDRGNQVVVTNSSTEIGWSSAGAQFYSPAVSIDMWLYLDELPDDEDSRFGLLDVQNHYALFVYGGGMLAFRLVNRNYDAPAALEAQRWHHIAATYSVLRGAHVYVDGTEVLSQAGNGPIVPDLDHGARVLGNAYGDVEPPLGRADNLRVFDRELTPVEICQAAGPLCGP